MELSEPDADSSSVGLQSQMRARSESQCEYRELLDLRQIFLRKNVKLKFTKYQNLAKIDENSYSYPALRYNFRFLSIVD